MKSYDNKIAKLKIENQDEGNRNINIMKRKAIRKTIPLVQLQHHEIEDHKIKEIKKNIIKKNIINKEIEKEDQRHLQDKS